MSNNNQATEEKVVENKNNNKVVEVKAKEKTKKNKEKKPSKVKKALKDTVNEIKKANWPKFKEVVKQTGIVLAFVVVCAVVLFGFDRLCEFLVGLLF